MGEGGGERSFFILLDEREAKSDIIFLQPRGMRVVGPHEEDSYIPIGPIWASLLLARAGFSEELLPHWAAPSSSVRQRTG